MEFYTAGRFHRREQIKEIQEQVLSHGHSITVDWTQHKNIDSYPEESELASEYALEDHRGAADSDVFVLLGNKSGRGSHMELGAAIESRRRTGSPQIFVIGELKDDSLIYFHPYVNRVESIEEVLKSVQE